MGMSLWEVSHTKVEAPPMTPEILDFMETWRNDQGTFTVHWEDITDESIPENASQELRTFIEWLKRYLAADEEYHDFAIF